MNHSIAGLTQFRLLHETTVQRIREGAVQTAFGAFQMHAFHEAGVPGVHLALVRGDIDATTPTLVRVAPFDLDVTPPLGSRMAYDPVTHSWDLGLRARGLVLQGDGPPIVLCAVDWIDIGNEGHDAFRRALAEAADTIPSRVAVHTVHQHDAPACDFGAETILQEAGVDPLGYEGTFARDVLRRLRASSSAA